MLQQHSITDFSIIVYEGTLIFAQIFRIYNVALQPLFIHPVTICQAPAMCQALFQALMIECGQRSLCSWRLHSKESFHLRPPVVLLCTFSSGRHDSNPNCDPKTLCFYQTMLFLLQKLVNENRVIIRTMANVLTYQETHKYTYQFSK